MEENAEKYKGDNSCSNCRHACIASISYWQCMLDTIGARSPLINGGNDCPSPNELTCSKWSKGKYDPSTREYVSKEARALTDFFNGVGESPDFVKVVKI
jgi:hypothetical protein